MDVLDLAAAGWRLIAIERGGKNPGSIVGANWPAKATSDHATVRDWVAAGHNLGVLLGPSSGIIDLEYDSDEGREIIEDACAGIETLSYRSAKSVHRLFVWDKRFEVERAKFGFRGTEWRFGQDAAQSVIPPSVHESGLKYEWLSDCEPARLPDSLWTLYQQLRLEHEATKAKQSTEPARDYGDDSWINSARTEIEKTSWSVLLEARGWQLIRQRGEAQDWRRPGKQQGSLSATSNYGGSGRLAVFSTACDPLEAEKSYDKFGFVCAVDFADDPIAAANSILPPPVLLAIDWDKLAIASEAEEIDDEDFCKAIIPTSGLLRDVYQYYGQKAYRRSHVMGLAVAVSVCETIFGRRIRSHTDLRTNDYNLILATTGSGKEACESTITSILDAASETAMIPPDVQSGNGLMKAVCMRPAAIWLCDEFGKILQAVLDKRGNQMLKNIGTHLLKLYGKSAGIYGGAAHADGVRNRVVQPCLTVLGLSTSSTVFSAVTHDQVADGLIGRIAFWPVQQRPEPRDDLTIVSPPEDMMARVKAWTDWLPVSSSDYPVPATLAMCDEAKHRWSQHAKAINSRMDSESELRAAIWSRVAARTMKLAIVHRAARLETEPGKTNWDFVFVERDDIEWAVSLSNWLARIACGLVSQNVHNKSLIQAKAVLLKALECQNEVAKRELLRACRSLTAGDIQSAADELGLETTKSATKGRPKVIYRKKVTL